MTVRLKSDCNSVSGNVIKRSAVAHRCHFPRCKMYVQCFQAQGEEVQSSCSARALWDGTAVVSIAKPLGVSFGIVWVSESNGAKSPTAPFLVWAPPLHHILSPLLCTSFVLHKLFSRHSSAPDSYYKLFSRNSSALNPYYTNSLSQLQFI